MIINSLCVFLFCSLNIININYKYYLNKNFDLFSSLLIPSFHQQAWALAHYTERKKINHTVSLNSNKQGFFDL